MRACRSRLTNPFTYYIFRSGDRQAFSSGAAFLGARRRATPWHRWRPLWPGSDRALVFLHKGKCPRPARRRTFGAKAPAAGRGPFAALTGNDNPTGPFSPFGNGENGRAETVGTKEQG